MNEGAAARSAPASVSELARIIEKAKSELERMIDLNPQVMLLVDDDGNVRRANRAALDLLSHSGYGELLGRPLASLFDCADRDFLPRLLANRSGLSGAETDASLPGRGVRRLQFSMVGAHGAGGNRVLLIEDLTESRRQEEALRRSLRRETVGELVGALMHNINQRLTVIVCRTQLLSLAAERGETALPDFRRGLAEIGRMVEAIDHTLRRAAQPKDFGTVPYLDDDRQLIIDLEGADAGEAGGAQPARAATK
jgi:nitrogen-specific signal transduction histidine kinase